MLNYVWLALLFLGIGAAITTDLVNQSTDKYKNDHALPAQLILPSDFNPDSAGIYTAQINVSRQIFNNFYRENTDRDINTACEVTIHKTNVPATVNFKMSGSLPKIWQEMAGSSGSKGELSGTIKIDSILHKSNAYAHIIFERVTFLKIKSVTNAALDYASTAVNIALGLIGIMALWLGIMKIAENAGLISIIAGWLRPLTRRLFPDVPPEHPAMGSMIMNMSANLLGLGNAATPFGLKAMEELNELNPNKETATNSMCTFLAINTAGMTLIPATAIAVRVAAGSTQPAVIIGTSLFASFCATVAGLTAAKVLEKFPLQKTGSKNPLMQSLKPLFILLGIAGMSLLIILSGIGKHISKYLGFLTPETFRDIIQVFSTLAIPVLIILFVGYGAFKKVKIYEVFVEGAKEGFTIAVKIIPYLVAMLVAIGIFRAGGAMDWLIYILHPVTNFIGMPAEALPMALMRPLSGSGSLGIMAEIISVHGPDSFIGILVSTFYGSTETTFYVLAVYFGAVNIRKIRHALSAGLIADIAGILAAVFIVRLLFGH